MTGEKLYLISEEKLKELYMLGFYDGDEGNLHDDEYKNFLKDKQPVEETIKLQDKIIAEGILELDNSGQPVINNELKLIPFSHKTFDYLCSMENKLIQIILREMEKK
jgi:hypothetical protein